MVEEEKTQGQQPLAATQEPEKAPLAPDQDWSRKQEPDTTEPLYSVEFILNAPDNGQEKYVIRGHKLAELPNKAKIAKEALLKMGYWIPTMKPVVQQAASQPKADAGDKQWFKPGEVEWDGDTPRCPRHGKDMRKAEKLTSRGQERWYCSVKADSVDGSGYCGRQVTR